MKFGLSDGSKYLIIFLIFCCFIYSVFLGIQEIRWSQYSTLCKVGVLNAYTQFTHGRRSIGYECILDVGNSGYRSIINVGKISEQQKCDQNKGRKFEGYCYDFMFREQKNSIFPVFQWFIFGIFLILGYYFIDHQNKNK